jgi:hypothetical protein
MDTPRTFDEICDEMDAWMNDEFGSSSPFRELVELAWSGQKAIVVLQYANNINNEGRHRALKIRNLVNQIIADLEGLDVEFMEEKLFRKKS